MRGRQGFFDTLSKISTIDLIELRRTVRLGIPCRRERFPEDCGRELQGRNGFAGMPPSDGFTAHHEVKVGCIGAPDPCTGYLLGIQEIDAIVRSHVAPLLQHWFASDATPTATEALRSMAAVVAQHLPSHAALSSLEWATGPFVHYLWRPTMPDVAILTEHFEFSAAHRLHCPSLSDEENRRTFGKCNHPSGHGHNYRVAVAVRVGTGPGAPPFGTRQLEPIVQRTVIERFDHRHLNVDCEEFRSLNPSVENIARVCHGLLAAECAAAGAALDHVTVWETEKTSATYPANAAR